MWINSRKKSTRYSRTKWLLQSADRWNRFYKIQINDSINFLKLTNDLWEKQCWFIYDLGPSPASFCINVSMNAQAEYKAKARFLALLRRCRLWSAAQWSLVSELVLSFRHCKGKPIILADYYKKWHVPFIVQSLAAFVQLFVQVLAFWPCSKHLSAALQRFFA